MEVRIDRSDDLTHWGIKGQKWGVRRYQNPDGTLTEAGKKRYYYQNPDGSLTDEGRKHYMTAAKKGKINPKKLSDADLNMINSRFAREKQYAQNISEYEKSKFSYKMKEAAIARIKGNNGGGGGGKGKGGGSNIGKLLAMPIKKAVEDALKFDPNKGGNDNSNDQGDEDRKFYKEYKKNGHKFVESYTMSKKDQKRLAKAGQRFIETNGRSSEDILRSRHTPMPKPTPKPIVSVAAKKEKEWDKLSERAAKSGLIISHANLTRYKVKRKKPDQEPEALTT